VTIARPVAGDYQVWVKEGRAWLRVGEPRPEAEARELVARMSEPPGPVEVLPHSPGIGDLCVSRPGRARRALG